MGKEKPGASICATHVHTHSLRRSRWTAARPQPRRRSSRRRSPRRWYRLAAGISTSVPVSTTACPARASPSRPNAAAPMRLLQLRGLPQHVVSAVLRHAREDVSRSPSRPPPRLAEGLDPSFRDLPRQRGAPGAPPVGRRPRPCAPPTTPSLSLPTWTVIRGRPFAHWMQPRCKILTGAVP